MNEDIVKIKEVMNSFEMHKFLDKLRTPSPTGDEFMQSVLTAHVTYGIVVYKEYLRILNQELLKITGLDGFNVLYVGLFNIIFKYKEYVIRTWIHDKSLFLREKDSQISYLQNTSMWDILAEHFSKDTEKEQYYISRYIEDPDSLEASCDLNYKLISIHRSLKFFTSDYTRISSSVLAICGIPKLDKINDFLKAHPIMLVNTFAAKWKLYTAALYLGMTSHFLWGMISDNFNNLIESSKIHVESSVDSLYYLYLGFYYITVQEVPYNYNVRRVSLFYAYNGKEDFIGSWDFNLCAVLKEQFNRVYTDINTIDIERLKTSTKDESHARFFGDIILNFDRDFLTLLVWEKLAKALVKFIYFSSPPASLGNKLSNLYVERNDEYVIRLLLWEAGDLTLMSDLITSGQQVINFSYSDCIFNLAPLSYSSNYTIKSSIQTILSEIQTNTELSLFIKQLQTTGSIKSDSEQTPTIYTSLKAFFDSNLYYDFVCERISSSAYPEVTYLSDTVEDRLCAILKHSPLSVIGIGSNRVVLGYNGLAIKIWYKTDIQHQDEIAFYEACKASGFLSILPTIHYYDDSMIITNRYMTGVQLDDYDVDDSEKIRRLLNIEEVNQLRENQDEIDYIREQLQQHGYSASDICTANIGVDAITGRLVLLDAGFQVGLRRFYLQSCDFLLESKHYKSSTRGLKDIEVKESNKWIFVESDKRIILKPTVDTEVVPLIQSLVYQVCFSISDYDSLDRIDILNQVNERIYNAEDGIYYIDSYLVAESSNNSYYKVQLKCFDTLSCKSDTIAFFDIIGDIDLRYLFHFNLSLSAINKKLNLDPEIYSQGISVDKETVIELFAITIANSYTVLPDSYLDNMFGEDDLPSDTEDIECF